MALLIATLRFDTADVYVRRGESVEIEGFILSADTPDAAAAMSLAWAGIAEKMRDRYRLPAEDDQGGNLSEDLIEESRRRTPTKPTLAEAEAANRAAGWTKVPGTGSEQ